MELGIILQSYGFLVFYQEDHDKTWPQHDHCPWSACNYHHENFLNLWFCSIFNLPDFPPVFLSARLAVTNRIRNLILAIVSLLFYTHGASFFTLVLATSTFLKYFLVHQMDTDLRHSKRWFRLSMVLNFSLILSVKYSNFIVQSQNIKGLGP